MLDCLEMFVICLHLNHVVLFILVYFFMMFLSVNHNICDLHVLNYQSNIWHDFSVTINHLLILE